MIKKTQQKIKNQHQINKEKAVKKIESNLTKDSMEEVMLRIFKIFDKTTSSMCSRMEESADYFEGFYEEIVNNVFPKEYNKDMLQFAIFFYSKSLIDSIGDKLQKASIELIERKIKNSLNRINPKIRNTILELI